MTSLPPEVQASLFGDTGVMQDKEAQKRQSIWLGVTKSALQKHVRRGETLTSKQDPIAAVFGSLDSERESEVVARTRGVNPTPVPL